MSHKQRIVVGTRPSTLALAQCSLISQALWAKSGTDATLALYRNSGDRAQGTSGAALVSKRAWVDDLEKALLAGDVDLVIHSSKDLPADIAGGTAASSILSRAAPNDVLVLRDADASSPSAMEALKNLPAGARVGTASARRRTQILRINPDLAVVEHRGNVPTRLRKLYDGDRIDAIILAEAGLSRLGYEHIRRIQISTNDMVPAAGQGTLVAQYREGDEDTQLVVQSLVDRSTELCWRAERVFLTDVGADCRSALGVFAEIADGQVALRYAGVSDDGKDMVSGTRMGATTSSEDLARQAAAEALLHGIGKFIH